MPKTTQEILVEDGRILFRNFSGNKTKFNQQGQRNFCLIIPEEIIDDLVAVGWNIKRLKPRDDDEVGDAYLKVNVNFEGFNPPRIQMIGEKTRKRTTLTEESVSLLDVASIAKVDIIVRPFNYNVNGAEGVSAYLKRLVVIIEEDPLDVKYSDLDGGVFDDE